MVTAAPVDGRLPKRLAADESGFSMVELMIALLVSVSVMGAAVSVVSGVQKTYQHQLEDVSAVQEARFALDWMRRVIEPAGSNPYSVNATCDGTTVLPIRFDPDGDTVHDDIRVQADVGIPDGLFVGAAGACTQANEDVTIALETLGGGTDPVPVAITRFDRGTDAAPVAVTDATFSSLRFEYLDASEVATTTPGSVRFVRVTVTGKSKQSNASLGRRSTFTLQSTVRLRAR